MKKILLLLGILTSIAAWHTVYSQDSQGVITYEAKANLHRRIPKERESMKAMIPEFRTSKHQLFFNADESIYKAVIEDEEEDMTSFSGGGVQMKFQMPNNERYQNQSLNLILSKEEFMGKEYLIEDSVKINPWKFGTETKVVMGYECKQAFYTKETQVMGPGGARTEKQEITAWYTDKIRPNLGPEAFGSLPGAVLAVDINNGERVLVAKKIEIRELKKNELKKPSSGTKTTRTEYSKMVEEQMKKMATSGGMFIRN